MLNITEATIIKGPSIEADIHDRYYMAKILCAWMITAPSNQVVVIRSVNFKLN